MKLTSARNKGATADSFYGRWRLYPSVRCCTRACLLMGCHKRGQTFTSDPRQAQLHQPSTIHTLGACWCAFEVLTADVISHLCTVASTSLLPVLTYMSARVDQSIRAGDRGSAWFFSCTWFPGFASLEPIQSIKRESQTQYHAKRSAWA